MFYNLVFTGLSFIGTVIPIVQAKEFLYQFKGSTDYGGPPPPPPPKPTNLLFDLDTDPFESVNQWSNATYIDLYSNRLLSRQKYWNSLSVAQNDPDVTNRSTAWAACGRVCDWIIEDDVRRDADIEQKYYFESAPNIVYILVDDWGFNDVGFRSTYLSWTTPTIDNLAREGVLLTNYYTNELCTPSRASFLTGRYNLRLGVNDPDISELPSNETTIAEELKSAGYMTYLVGKWHQGQSKRSLWPLQRGFDYFYGYMNGIETYWSKENDGYVDLFENNDFVVNQEELDPNLHSGYLYETKAEAVIKNHASQYNDIDQKRKPFFLYYSMQLIHSPWTAPDIYLQRCMNNSQAAIIQYEINDFRDEPTPGPEMPYNYCAMNVMLDEAIANLTCTLKKYGFANNTVLVVAGDNGGQSSGKGNSLPFRGHKNSTMRGGVSNTAIVHSELLPEYLRGKEYNGLSHITDWLPTFMGLATNWTWEGSYSGAVIDGYDIWPGILSNKSSGREEIIFLSRPEGQYAALDYGHIKYSAGVTYPQSDYPTVVFDEDLRPDLNRQQCNDPFFESK